MKGLHVSDRARSLGGFLSCFSLDTLYVMYALKRKKPYVTSCCPVLSGPSLLRVAFQSEYVVGDSTVSRRLLTVYLSALLF